MMDLKITRNGIDVTYPNKPEKKVMIGERNTMAVSVSPIPVGVPITYQWNIPSDPIKNFHETEGSPGNPNSTPPVPPTPYTGDKEDLPASDLQVAGLYFYWYNASFDGDSKEISVVITLDGKPITVKGRLKVFAPKLLDVPDPDPNKPAGSTVPLFTGTWTSNEPPVALTPNFYVNLGNKLVSPGISLRAAVVAPGEDDLDSSGVVGFEQLISKNQQKFFTVQGVPKHTIRQGNPALDSLDPEARYPSDPGNTNEHSIASSGSSIITTDDSPGVPVLSENKVTLSDSYKSYVVYKPHGDNSIWVTVGRLDWAWSFTAEFEQGHWVVKASAPQVGGTIIRGGNTHELLKWVVRGQDLKDVEITP